MVEKNSCVRCGHFPKNKEQYCTKCGSPLYNRCTFDGGILGDPCHKINHPSASFCASCGSPTRFQKEGLLSSTYPQTKRVEIEDLDSLQHFSHKFFKG